RPNRRRKAISVCDSTRRETRRGRQGSRDSNPRWRHWRRGMAQLFDQLEPEHIEFIDRQRLFFVATATDGAHPNLSPKAYCSLAVLDPRRLIHVDWPGSGNQTATHIAEHGRVTLMFLSFERAPLILRVFGSAKVLHRRSREFAALVPLLGERVGPHT